jgi:catechol 2,3-dioxygenase-like lactoylglutathione lyase family enzyme
MTPQYSIAGIQQIGIGTENMKATWQWYIDHFDVNIRILEDDTVAELMLPYTGNRPQKRHACIALNLQGGGGLEIWQYTSRQPQPTDFDIHIGDLGIFAAKLKSRDVVQLHKMLTAKYPNVGELTKMPDNTPCFYLADPCGNYLQVVEDKYVYIDEKRLTGGAVGAMIGVSDIERAMPIYRDILGYDTVVYDKTGLFDDWHFMRGGDAQYRRVLLCHSQPRKGAFSAVFGASTIELVTAIDRRPHKIYEGRQWGDPGFIQICFDVSNMAALGRYCAEKGFPFTVDSCPNLQSFDMGDASGHFTYIEDPDGTLIEFVETHKLPIIKKIGLNIDLKKRKQNGALPKFLLHMLRMNRVKKMV